MNKKDLRELKKNFSDTSDLFTMNHVVTAFVDAEKNIRCQNSQAYHDIPQEEAFCYWKTFKKVLSGSLGKGLLEYEFPKEAYEEGAPQQILYQALNTKLKDESDVSVLLDQIVRQMDATSMYAILVAHCTYTVFNKTRNDEKNPYDSLDYSFLAVAICPVEVRTDGLIYNETDNEIMKKIDTDRIVAEGQRSRRQPRSLLYPQAERGQCQPSRTGTRLQIYLHRSTGKRTVSRDAARHPRRRTQLQHHHRCQ